MTLLKAILEELEKIEKDCIQLQKEGMLTEYGKGQLDLIRIIREIIERR